MKVTVTCTVTVTFLHRVYTCILKAISIGYAVPRMDFDATVHSVFRSAINLSLDNGEVICLHWSYPMKLIFRRGFGWTLPMISLLKYFAQANQ